MTENRTAPETLADIGEDALLDRIFPELPCGAGTLLGPGDDAAVVAVPDGRVVISTDVLVEGRHFRRDWSSGADVGWRAAMQNLSDIAAMGARPTSMVVSLVMPPDLPVEWAVDFACGLRQACGPHGVGVVGGDLSGGESIVVAVTVHGDLGGREPVLRSGALPGDVVAHAGVAGRSAAGYAILAAGHTVLTTGLGDLVDAYRPESVASVASVASVGQDRFEAASADAVRVYRRPEPPLAAGLDASDAGATAMMDVSDGLLRDAGRLARASGVVIDLAPLAEAFAADLEALAPVAEALGANAEEWVLTGGEDHGLLATFPAGVPLPAPFREIGRVWAVRAAPTGAARGSTGFGPVSVLVDGVRPTVASSGWDHFSSS